MWLLIADLFIFSLDFWLVHDFILLLINQCPFSFFFQRLTQLHHQPTVSRVSCLMTKLEPCQDAGRRVIHPSKFSVGNWPFSSYKLANWFSSLQDTALVFISTTASSLTGSDDSRSKHAHYCGLLVFICDVYLAKYLIKWPIKISAHFMDRWRNTSVSKWVA